MFIELDKLQIQGLKQANIVVPAKSIGGGFVDHELTKFGCWADWKIAPQSNLGNAPGDDEVKADKSKVGTVARYFFQHFRSEETIQWLGRFRDLRLSDEEARALVAVREQGAIDNAMYRELNRVDTLAASQSLRRLRDAGLLEQKGRGSATYYEPKASLLGEGEDDGLPSDLGHLSSNPDGLSSNPSALSSNPSALSSNPMWQGLPVELQGMVAALSQRGNTDKVREAIIRLCQYRPWQATELGSLFGRNPVYLGTQYLRPLVSAGVLAYTMPEQPNHPHQAYQTVEGSERGDAAQ